MFNVNRLAPAGAVSIVVCLAALTLSARADDNKLWQTDFEAAKAKAKAERKLLLVDFTGSDWCGWCIRLKAEVFDKEEFRTEAPKQFILVELDFPHEKKLPEKLQAQNDKLAKQYAVEGFPTVLMMDVEGQVIARTGYRPDGPEPYVKHLAECVKIHGTIAPMRAELKKAQGLARARILDRLIEAYAKLENEIDEIETWGREIVTLDAENKAGLKGKYEYRILMADAAQLKESKKYDEAGAKFEKVLALPGLQAEQKQDVYLAQGECFYHQKDFSGVIGCLKKALAAAPESSKASQLKEMIQRFAAVAEAQEAVAKLKAGLAKAQGLDRARLLDQLVEVSGKAGSRGGRESARESEKWTQEILSLDADNKAGLKGKYELFAARNEGLKLLKADKSDEAHALIDKALARPGLKPENIQQGLIAKGLFYFLRQDHEKSVATFKKAIDAAPDTRSVAEIKRWMAMSEKELQKKKTGP